MIKNNEQIKKELNLLRKNWHGQGFLQKIYSTSRFVCITIRFPGATTYLYLGRGHGHEGLWIGNKPPPPMLRRKDRFLEYLRKHLESSKLGDIGTDENDRIITIEYVRRTGHNILGIFWRGREVYFFNYYYDEEIKRNRLFLSWSGMSDSVHELDEENVVEKLKNYFGPLGRISLNKGNKSRDSSTALKESNSKEKSIEDLLQEEIMKLKGLFAPGKKLAFLEKKRKKIGSDLEKIGKWRDLQEKLRKDDVRLEGVQQIELFGITFKFPKEWGHFKKIELIYEKLKKLKAGEEIQLRRLKETEKEISLLEAKKEVGDFRSGPKINEKMKMIEPVWAKDKGQRVSRDDTNVDGIKIVEINLKGVKIGIGTSDKANDFLRNKWGKENNLWFHLDGLKGAHAVAKISSISELLPEQIAILGSILRDYSRLEINVIPLIFAQLKNVKGVKGAPGKVIVKKGRHYTVNYCEKWKEEILKD